MTKKLLFVIIGDAVSSGRRNVTVISVPVDHEITINNDNCIRTTIEISVKVQNLERRITIGTGTELDNFVRTFGERSPNAILAAFDYIINPRIEISVRSKTRLSDGMLLVLPQIQNAEKEKKPKWGKYWDHYLF